MHIPRGAPTSDGHGRVRGDASGDSEDASSSNSLLSESVALSESESMTIDEVVLVGGCSLLPCVRGTIQTALREVGVTTFGRGGYDSSSSSGSSSSGSSSSGSSSAGGEREVPPEEGDGGGGGERAFCSSVNPHECVAHGLAVKGALMMGVREGRLKELLMIDSVPYAVGILSFITPLPPANTSARRKEEEEGGEGKEEEEGESWVFDPVLERGMRLPCTARKTFPLAASSLQARQVSLDIYEETFEGNSVDAAVVFISNCDLPIGHLRVCSAEAGAEAGAGAGAGTGTVDRLQLTVDVIFHMTENGEVKYAVEDSRAVLTALQQRQQAAGRDGGSSSSSSSSTLVLGLYLTCLLVLYVVVKVVIVGNSELVADLQARGYSYDEASDVFSEGLGQDMGLDTDVPGQDMEGEGGDLLGRLSHADVMNSEFEF